MWIVSALVLAFFVSYRLLTPHLVSEDGHIDSGGIDAGANEINARQLEDLKDDYLMGKISESDYIAAGAELERTTEDSARK